jgi:hypothetical protein
MQRREHFFDFVLVQPAALEYFTAKLLNLAPMIADEFFGLPIDPLARWPPAWYRLRWRPGAGRIQTCGNIGEKHGITSRVQQQPCRCAPQEKVLLYPVSSPSPLALDDAPYVTGQSLPCPRRMD